MMRGRIAYYFSSKTLRMSVFGAVAAAGGRVGDESSRSSGASSEDGAATRCDSCKE